MRCSWPRLVKSESELVDAFVCLLDGLSEPALRGLAIDRDSIRPRSVTVAVDPGFDVR